MNNYSSKLIEELINSISSLDQAKTDAKMLLAAKIADALKAKNWKHKDLLKALGKENPSVISKWLSGTHNFTVDTLIELEFALEIQLLNLEEKNEKLLIKLHAEAKQEVSANLEYNHWNKIILSKEPFTLSKSYSTEISYPNS